jgi:hypothetical protein
MSKPRNRASGAKIARESGYDERHDPYEHEMSEYNDESGNDSDMEQDRVDAGLFLAGEMARTLLHDE